MEVHDGLHLRDRLGVRLGKGPREGLEDRVAERLLDEEGTFADSAPEMLAAEHARRCAELAADLGCELLEELAAGQGPLELVSEVDGLAVLHEAVRASAQEA
jgi:hypothetical protein